MPISEAPSRGDAVSDDAVGDSRRKVYIRTFGCQMNEYDTAKLYRILESDYLPVTDPAFADLIIVNTCSVRDKAEHKLYSALGTFRVFKQAKPDLLIGVGGCVAQQEGHEILKRCDNVDFVFGTHNLSLVPALISMRRQGGPQQAAVDYRDDWEELPEGFSEQSPGLNPISAFVSVSRGCNKNCTYCIVPKTRGTEVSRALDEVLREVKLLARRGVREVVLLGQTVNSYGRDLRPRISFADLLQRVSEVDGIERIRFTSPHPQDVQPDFYELLESNPKICRHIHLPLQSGSDSILKAMKRTYNRERFLGIVAKLRTYVPDIEITSDLIVGFPGETEQDFRETLEAVKISDFRDSFSFVFSPRPGTEAASMKDDLSQEVKLERLKILQSTQAELTGRRLGEWQGREGEVLLEGPSQADVNCLQGRLSQNITVNLDQNEPDLRPGMLVPVKITRVSRFTLSGRAIAR